MMLSILVLISFACKGDDPPEALRNMETQRSRIRTAEIHGSEEYIVGEAMTIYRNRSWRIAGSDVHSTNRGDREGVIMRTESGKPSPLYKNPIQSLRRDGLVWEHEDLNKVAEVSDGDRPIVPDPRTFGMLYGHSFRDLSTTVWVDPAKQPSARRYTEEVEGPLTVVTAETDVGTIRWWIDARKDWSATRVALYVNGKLISECRSELGQFDGIWFPTNVQYFSTSHKNGREPVRTININSATFNRPEHPARIRPEDIGIEPLSMSVIKRDSSGNEAGMGVFDGHTFASMGEMQERAERRRDALRAEAGNQGDSSEKSSDDPARSGFQPEKFHPYHTAWERLTREFIDRFGLDKPQSETAWKICRDCQRQARIYITRHRVDFERLRDSLASMNEKELATLAEQQTTEKPDQRPELSDLKKLFAPISEIAERQLIPRLEKLPTRAQRKSVIAAGETAAVSP